MDIPLTQGKVAVIDDQDAESVLAHKWYAISVRNGLIWYAASKIKGRAILLHSFLTKYPRTDHKDGDGLNNRRNNLRRCTRSQNAANCRKPRGATSRFKGVSWSASRNKWQATIQCNGRGKFLGYFTNEEDAAAAYRAAAISMFGEFARF